MVCGRQLKKRVSVNPPGDGPLRDGTKDLWKDNSKVGQGVHNLIKVITRTACNQKDAVQGKRANRLRETQTPSDHATDR